MTAPIDALGRQLRGTCPQCGKPARSGRHCSRICGEKTKRIAKAEELRAWHAEYARTERRRALMRRYRAKYNRTEKGRAAQHRAYIALAARHPEKIKARGAVSHAVVAGTLVRPAACSACAVAGPVQAHHHKGYEPAHWLDVVWLCRGCHLAAEAAE